MSGDDEETLRTIRRLIAQEETAPRHLDYEDLEACADGKLAGVALELIQGHVEICAQCKSDLDELSGLAAAMKPAIPQMRALGLGERGVGDVSRIGLPAHGETVERPEPAERLRTKEPDRKVPGSRGV